MFAPSGWHNVALGCAARLQRTCVHSPVGWSKDPNKFLTQSDKAIARLGLVDSGNLIRRRLSRFSVLVTMFSCRPATSPEPCAVLRVMLSPFPLFGAQSPTKKREVTCSFCQLMPNCNQPSAEKGANTDRSHTSSCRLARHATAQNH